MSETTSVVNFKWRNMDSVIFDDDSSLDEHDELQQQNSEDTLTPSDIATKMSHDGDDDDENDSLDFLQQPNAEQQALLQSPETTPIDSFPDTPNLPNMLAGWNVTNEPKFPRVTSKSNSAPGNLGMNAPGTPKTANTTHPKSTSAADLLDQIEGPVS